MNRRRIVTSEERSLWIAAIRDAKPMPGRSLGMAPEPISVPVTPVVQTKIPDPPAVALVRASRRVYVHIPPPPLKPGHHPNVDGNTADRLRRGKLTVDGRIDLHGMTQAQAHTALASFIHRAWHEGRRCVLVITGKGNFSVEGGVLRHCVPLWLADAALRPMVLAIQPAQPKDGGDGALYVLVKRRRTYKDAAR